MDEPKSLDSLFKEKIFRIPDYQRGYAWQESQLRDFWEDLINLSSDRSHYTGVLTLLEVKAGEVGESHNEYWLVEDHSYKMYEVVDGQQRLTTFVVFLQAFVDFFRGLDENKGKEDSKIYITDSLDLESVIEKYLFKTRTSGDRYRTYKFGYNVDNPSYEYLRYKIFMEEGAGEIQETFYTLNLENAKRYFCGQLEGLGDKGGVEEIKKIYKKLTKKFLFNEYVIRDRFDVFVAFETMNNRGKKLSDLELLKNRLIYLTTLYTDEELDVAEQRSLRDAINETWKEVYHQLGRNKKRPLNDDDFLKAHWTMYFKFSRQTGNDYISFLLDEQFSPHKVHKKIERKVELELPEEQRSEFESDDDTESEEVFSEDTALMTAALLEPTDIKEYVNSLKESAEHWFNSYYPDLATGLETEEIEALNRLNRIGVGYFRPLVMSFFKKEKEPAKRVEFLDRVERFIFIVFYLCQSRSHYRSSEFFNAARAFNEGRVGFEGIKAQLDEAEAHCFKEDGTLNSELFRNLLQKKFHEGKKIGCYGWGGLKYFLYEYDLSLLEKSRQPKLLWDTLKKDKKDKISIEHIFPQTPTDNWKRAFSGVSEKDYHFYSGSLGNFLLLSTTINSLLQNDSFNEKKARNGYSNGSASEIEVSKYDEWTPKQIEERGLDLLSFMEERWEFKFGDEEAKKDLLFLHKREM